MSQLWFGSMESNWPVVPLREFAALGTGHTPSRENEEYWENCTIPWVTIEDIRENGIDSLKPLLDTRQKISELGLANSAAVLHRAGTVMLSRTASIGFSCVIDREMATTQAFVTWTPNETKLDSRFLNAALMAMRQHYFALAYGATHLTIYFPDVKTLKIPLPPLREQKLIANFLDHETAKIDTLIEKQQQLIKLLQEKRQAVISHAVTKGLNPNAPMRDSGVEWLGEVPEHWPLLKVSYVGRVLNGSTPDKSNLEFWTDGVIPWLSSSCLNSDLIDEPSEFISERAYKTCSVELIPSGSLLVGMVGQGKTRGTSAILNVESCINQNMAAIIPNSKIKVRFLFYIFRAMYEDLRDLGRGGNQAALNCEIIGSIRIPVPSIKEQLEIISQLDELLLKFERIDDLASEQIGILQERRTALISAAVTGKIDVRDWVAPAQRSGEQEAAA